MAKRRRESDEKPPIDLGFQVEPFDEHELVLKEKRGFRSAFITIGWSLVAAIASFLVWVPIENGEFAWEIALLVGLGVGALLKWVLPFAKVPVADFKRKDWFGTGMTFFFSWLAFILLLANPPIHDGSPPAWQVQVTPRVQEIGGEVFVYVVLGDNAGVDWDSVDLSVSRAGTDLGSFENVGGRRGHFVWHATVTEEGEYEVHGTAADFKDNTASLDRHFRVVGESEALTVKLPDRETFDDQDDKVLVRLAPCEGDDCLAPGNVWRVVASFPNGKNVTLKYDREEKFWWTSPRIEGNSSWGGEGDTAVTVRLQEHAAGQRSALHDAAIEKGPYNLTITKDFPIEEGKDRSPKARPLRSQAPGIEFGLLALGLVVAVALTRRRKDR